jgi:hypothetical protein
MEPVDLQKVVEDCERIIARHPNCPNFDIAEGCLHEDHHSDQCLIGMEEWSQPCVKVEAENAEQRLTRILFLYLLKDCARNPAAANGLHTLDGMAQDSCVYDIKYSRLLLFVLLPYNQVLTYSGAQIELLYLFRIRNSRS